MGVQVETGRCWISTKYKTRIVVKGFQQKKGVDFNKIFAPVVKMTSTQTVLRIAASMVLKLKQLDVKMTFLHVDLEGMKT